MQQVKHGRRHIKMRDDDNSDDSDNRCELCGSLKESLYSEPIRWKLPDRFYPPKEDGEKEIIIEHDK